MIRTLSVVRAFAIASLLVCSARFCQAGNKPLPPEAALESAKRLIIETFRKELSASDKAPAAKAMLETAEKTTGDDAGQAALYLSAADVAARAGETKLAFDALDQLGAAFHVDLPALKLSAMETAAKYARTNEARVSVANRCLELVDEASRAGRFEVAESALKTAAATASKVRDAELRKEIATRRRDIEKARRAAEHAEQAVAAAQKTLKEDASNASANETLGKYLAFDRNDWTAGLKHLAKAGDAALRKAAAADQAGSADQAKALGDQWWALADSAVDARDRAGYRSRAVFWYTRAIGTLTGLQKTLLEKRIAEAGAEALASAADQTGGDNGKYLDITLAPGVLLRLVKIPASDDGKIKSFYLGQTEVTQKQWQAVMGSNPSEPKGDDLPVNYVTHKECRDFCRRLGESSAGMRFLFSLPNTDAWFYACLAGQRSLEDADPSSLAGWNSSNSKNSPHPVASLSPNGWGLHDMLGNCWEWANTPRDMLGGSYDQPLSAAMKPASMQDDDSKAYSIGFRVFARAK